MAKKKNRNNSLQNKKEPQLPTDLPLKNNEYLAFINRLPHIPENYQWLIALFLSITVCSVLRLLEAPAWNNPFFEINGEKLLATHDAYIWTAVAQGSGRFPDSALPQILKFLHDITNIKTGNLAFWLPVFFAPLVAVPLCWLGKKWKMPESGLVAGIMGGSVLGYLLRTRLGFFDTDIGTLFFPVAFVVGLCLWLAPIGRSSWIPQKENIANQDHNKKRNLAYAVSLGILCQAYLWFHPNAQKITLPFIVLAVCLWLVLAWPKFNIKMPFYFLILYILAYGGISGYIVAVAVTILIFYFERLLHDKKKYFIILGVSLLISFYLAGFWANLEGVFTQAFYWTKSSTVEETLNSTSLSLPSISQSIREAQNVDWGQIVSRCAGNWLIFLLGIAGYLYLVLKRPLALLFLPFFFLGIASAKMGNRFTLYAGAGWGVGIGFGVSQLLISLKQNQTKRWLIQLILAVIVIWPLWSMASRLGPGPILPKVYAQTFIDLEKKSAPDARLWQWWDYGYAAQYYAGRMSFSDGGLNVGKWVYPLAKVHTTNSPLQANQIMKFTTLNQKKDWEKDKDSFPKTWYPAYYMADPIAGFDKLSPQEATEKLQSLSSPMDFKQDIPDQYLVVSWENLRLAYWISYFGNWNMITGQTVPGKIQRIQGQAKFDTQKGNLHFSQGSMLLDSLDVIDKNSSPHLTWPNGKGLHAVLNQLSHELYIMDNSVYRSMMVQLLIADPSTFKPYFELTVDHFPWARAYKAN